MRFSPRLLNALIALLAVAPAVAQQTPPAANPAFKAMIGKWEMSTADHDRACIVTFRPEPSGPLFRLEPDKTCAAQLPELKDVAGWSIGGLDLVRLVDRKGKVILEFSEVEGGIFEAQRPGEGVFFLQNEAAAAAATTGVTLDQMAGDWNVVRGSGKAVCTLTLTDKSAGGDAFALRIKPGCETFVTAFGPASWSMERGALVLKSKAGRVWRFEADDPANWQRVPEGREPVNLVRQ
jgi:hypothetical protein